MLSCGLVGRWVSWVLSIFAAKHPCNSGHESGLVARLPVPGAGLNPAVSPLCESRRVGWTCGRAEPSRRHCRNHQNRPSQASCYHLAVDMRERITFFQRAGAAFDPAELQVTDLSIGGPSTEAAREDRLTFSLEDLPTEVRGLLSECHELHIRWVAPHSFEALSPLLSRLSPGFHIFYTPRHEAARSPRLCTALNQAFGDIKCSTPAVGFPSDASTSDAF